LAIIIDGKAISERKRGEIAEQAAEFTAAHGRAPGLAVVLVGSDPASEIYVRNKKKGCEACGIRSFAYDLAAETSEAELLDLIAELNANAAVDGILVQLPLPKHIDEEKVLLAIAPDKDVDGFHPYNMGRLLMGKPTLTPCTPTGVMEMFKAYDIELAGKDAVVVGRSNIVGKPQALLLMMENATVTICHSRTKDLAEKVRQADIVVAAIGKAEFIKGDWIKPGAVVIDVGMNRTEAGLKGDVEFAEAFKRASHITPVPGGVGPMTITLLLQNTLEAARSHVG